MNKKEYSKSLHTAVSNFFLERVITEERMEKWFAVMDVYREFFQWLESIGNKYYFQNFNLNLPACSFSSTAMAFLRENGITASSRGYRGRKEWLLEFSTTGSKKKGEQQKEPCKARMPEDCLHDPDEVIKSGAVLAIRSLARAGEFIQASKGGQLRDYCRTLAKKYSDMAASRGRKVEFDPSKDFSVDDKIVSYERTKRNGDPDYTLPSSRKNTSPAMREICHTKMRVNDFEFNEQCQRPRHNVSSDALIQSWLKGSWDWEKFGEISLVKFIDKNRKKHFYCTDGQGRTIYLKKTGQGNIPVPVRYFETTKWEDVLSDYFSNHDNASRTKITKADDFETNLSAGREFESAVVDEVIDSGMSYHPESLGVSVCDCDMWFNRNDIHQIVFGAYNKAGEVPETTARNRLEMIRLYAKFRHYFNDGQPISSWVRVIAKIQAAVALIRKEYGLAEDDAAWSVDSLFRNHGRRIKLGEDEHERMVSYFNNRQSKAGIVRDASLFWLSLMKRHNLLSDWWSQTAYTRGVMSYTYYDQLKEYLSKD